MNEEKIIEWMTNSPVSFTIGVIFLALGSKSLLSKENVQEKLGGIAIPFQWLHDQWERQAVKEADEAVQLQRDYREQQKYIVWVTRLCYAWEVWAASNGQELPPPAFLTLDEWREKYSK